jgi:hypothetical protein
MINPMMVSELMNRVGMIAWVMAPLLRNSGVPPDNKGTLHNAENNDVTSSSEIFVR